MAGGNRHRRRHPPAPRLLLARKLSTGRSPAARVVALLLLAGPGRESPRGVSRALPSPDRRSARALRVQISGSRRIQCTGEDHREGVRTLRGPVQSGAPRPRASRRRVLEDRWGPVARGLAAKHPCSARPRARKGGSMSEKSDARGCKRSDLTSVSVMSPARAKRMAVDRSVTSVRPPQLAPDLCIGLARRRGVRWRRVDRAPWLSSATPQRYFASSGPGRIAATAPKAHVAPARAAARERRDSNPRPPA